MGWSYLKSTLLGEDQIGPVSDAEFIEAVKSRTIKPSTRIHHAKFTNNDWIIAKNNKQYLHIAQRIKIEKRAENAKAAEKKRLRETREKENRERRKAEKEQQRQRQLERRNKERAIQNEQNDWQELRASTFAEISLDGKLARCCFCKGDVPPDAAKCKHCGEILNREWRLRIEQPQIQSRSSSWVGWAVVGIVVICCSGGIFQCDGPTNNSNQTSSVSNRTKRNPQSPPNELATATNQTPKSFDRNPITVPSSVLNKIRRGAIKEWPDDYEMQAYTIEQEKEAYIAIRIAVRGYEMGLESKMPERIFYKICRSAEENWPDDYGMQEYEINNQIDAWLKLNAR